MDIIISILMIWVVLLGVALIGGKAQVSHEPIKPKVVDVHIGRTVKTIPSNTAFSEVFPILGYDIGGKVYETNEGLVDQTLFDTYVYSESTSCNLYRT